MGMKTSLVAMFCAVTGMATGAYAAPSVRVIGGGNTYTSAAAASTNNKDTGDTASRAGSLRVMPAARTTSGATKSATLSGSKTIPNTTTVGRAVTTPRLSVGKYIGTSIPKSVSSANLSSDLTGRLDTIEANIQNLKMDKQDNISGTEFITVTNNNEVMLEVEALKDALSGVTRADIEMGTDEGETWLLWRYKTVPESEWKRLIELEKIRGDMSEYATVTALNSAITNVLADLGNYYTKTETDTKLADKLDKSFSSEQGNRFVVTGEDGRIITKSIDELPGMSNYYTREQTESAIAAAVADIDIDLSGKVDVALGTGEENKVLVTDEYGNVTTAPKSDLTPDMSDYYKKTETFTQTEVTSAIDSAVASIDLSGKVDKAHGSEAANKVLVTDAYGNVTVGDVGIDASGLNINDTDTAKASMPTGYAVNQALKAKADADLGNADMGSGNANKVLATDGTGKVYASADYATAADVYNYVDSAIAGIDVTDLGFGALAHENTVRNELIDNDTIQRGKLATNIQEALTTIMDEAPSDGQYVLSHTPDGGLVWTPVQQ